MKIYLYLICLMGIAQFVAADVQTLHFSNGDRLSGQILERSATHVTIVTSFGQQLQVPSELLETQGDKSKEIEVTSEEIVAASKAKQRSWDAHVELNSTFSRGNTDSSLLNLQADYKLERNRHRYDVDFSSLREEKDGNSVKEQDRLILGYNYLYSDRWFFALNSTIEQDPISLLEHRISLNPAVGYDVWNESDRTLNVQLGAGYSSERVAKKDESSSLIDWRLKYGQYLMNGDLEVFHTHQIYRNLEGRQNTVFNSQTGLRYDLTDDIYVNVQLNYDYDTEPALDTEAEDITFLIGAGVSL